MDELVAFLRAALDRDQAHAEKDIYVIDQATSAGEWTAHYGRNLPYSEIWSDGGIAFRVETPRHQADVMAIARLVKAARQRAERMLAEVQAKRRILELHPPFADHAGRVRCEACAELCHSRSGLGCDDPADAMYPCETVVDIARLLAQPYAGQPGWRDEWVV